MRRATRHLFTTIAIARALDRLGRLTELAGAETARDGRVNVVTDHRIRKAQADAVALRLPELREQIAVRHR